MSCTATDAAKFEDLLPLPASAPRWKRVVFALLLSVLSVCLPTRGHTAGLDCPETGPGAVPTLLTDVQSKLVMSGQRRSCQRDQRSHQQAADRETQHFLR